MSGYLSNLLRRTFDSSAGVVQPRLNALFAPPEKSSAWPALQFTDQVSGPIGELTGKAEGATALSNDLPRSSPRARGSSPTKHVDSSLTAPMSAASTSGSHGLPLGGVASESGEEAERTPAVSDDLRRPLRRVTSPPPTNRTASPVGAARTRSSFGIPLGRASESGDTSRPVLTRAAEAHTGTDGKPLPIVIPAKPLRDKGQIGNRTADVRGGKEQSSGVAPAEEHSPERGFSARLNDRRPAASGKPSGARALAAVPSDHSQATEAARAPEARVRHLEPPATKTETRKVFPALAEPRVQSHEATRSAAGGFAESTLGHGPLSLRAAHFRELGRREPEQIHSTESTIEVTIGRIEVRGVAAAEPRRAAAQPSRGLSLEEYLRRRSGRSSE
jgi:hypothetical protein